LTQTHKYQLLVTDSELALSEKFIFKTELQFNISVQGTSYLSHVENSKNQFAMTIVM